MITKSIVLSALMAGLSSLPVSAAPAASAASSALAASSVPAVSVVQPAPDTTFLRAVHQANMAEIAGGNIAQERGVSSRVRALGARFVRDHTAIDTRLTAVARAAGVMLPDTPTAAQLALTKRYQSVPSSSFDRLYLHTQLKAHNEALAAGKAELANGQDTRVKQLVAYAAPLVQAHHDALTAALATSSYGSPAR
jgi:putative membrane protein